MGGSRAWRVAVHTSTSLASTSHAGMFLPRGVTCLASRMTTAAPELTAAALVEALAERASEKDVAALQRYFKTGPGGYGEGDVFIGVRVPVTREVIKPFTQLPLAELGTLLASEVHEHRLAALLVLAKQFQGVSGKRGFDQERREAISTAYLNAVYEGRVNNWDLVDSSAEIILGGWLFDRPRELLFDLAASSVLWERRVAIISSYGFIRRGDASTTLELCTRLLGDSEDLMHKAVGWMLREVGKRVDRTLLTEYLEEHAAAMPRTALSYACEHLSDEERAHFRSLR